MQSWIRNYRGKVRLAISEDHTDGIPVCEPFKTEIGVNAYMHIDAKGFLKKSSFEQSGVMIDFDKIMGAVEILVTQGRGENV